MTKLEEVARAIQAKVPFGYSMTEAEAIGYARAAIEALRWPRERMLARVKPALDSIYSGNKEDPGYEVSGCAVWQAMLAAVLEEG